MLIVLIAGFSFGEGNCHPVIPNSEAYLSSNKELVLIVWKKAELVSEVGFPVDEFSKSNYPVSGLYEINGRKLLWTTDFSQSYVRYVPLDDKQHLITYNLEFNPYDESDSYEKIVLSIFKEGKALKRFQVKDFCTKSNYMMKSSGEFISWAKDFSIDNLNKKIFIESCNAKYIINISTASVSKEYQIPNIRYFYYAFETVTFFMLLFSPVLLIARFYMFLKNRGSVKQRKMVTLLIMVFFLSFPLLLFSRNFVKWNINFPERVAR